MDIRTARGIAGRIWCDQDYSHITMNVEVAERIAWLLVLVATVDNLSTSKSKKNTVK